MFIQVQGPVPIETGNPTQTYRIRIKVMHGDADKYEDCWIDFKQGSYSVEDIVRYYDILQKISSCSARDWSEIGEEDIDDITKDYLGDCWPLDVTSNYSFHACIYSVHLTFFDRNGVERKTKIWRGEDLKRLTNET